MQERRHHDDVDSSVVVVVGSAIYNGWRGGLVVGRRTCDLVVAGSRPGRDAAA